MGGVGACPLGIEENYTNTECEKYGKI